MISRRTILLASAGLTVLACPAWSAEEFHLEELVSGIYVHIPRLALVSKANEGDIANLGVIIGRDAIAVIDSGGSPTVGKKFLSAIRKVSSKPIRYVINTHVHPDHTFGNIVFAETGVTFVGHKNLPRAIAGTQQHYLASYREQLGSELMEGMTFVPPTMLVDHELSIDLGNRKLLLTAWPAAHTDSDLTVFDEMTGTIFSGDLLFRRHVPIIDGSLKGWLEVMEGLSRIAVQRAVPGHGPADLPWQEALAQQRAYLDDLASDLRNDIREGRSISDVIKTAGAKQRENWDLFDDYNPRNATQAFKELEWE